MWSDQPPFHTFVITQLLEHVSGSVLIARVVTVVWGVVLLGSVFLICLRVSGLFTAAVATALLIFSPGFLELSASCMLEIPALGPSMAAVAVLLVAPNGGRISGRLWRACYSELPLRRS